MVPFPTKWALENPFQIGSTFSLTEPNPPIPQGLLPKQFPDDTIRTADRKVRAKLSGIRAVEKGSQGTIFSATRTDASGNMTRCAMKTPNFPDSDLHQEALVQSIAEQALRAQGVCGAIPQVQDLFVFVKERRFTMQWIEGISSYEFLKGRSDGEFQRAFFQMLAQVSLLLAILEKVLRLDHRDLKMNNLWIRPHTPISQRVRLEGQEYSLEAPFQVVLLDFGFACLGDAKGVARVNLGDGVLPSQDTCPKIGRDLFQLCMSFWSEESLRVRLSKGVQDEILSWLKTETADQRRFHEMFPQSDWTQLVTSDLHFHHPPFYPLTLLPKIAKHLSSLQIHSDG